MMLKTDEHRRLYRMFRLLAPKPMRKFLKQIFKVTILEMMVSPKLIKPVDTWLLVDESIVQ